MRIQVVRSGGFAGLRRERAVETEQLPPGERADLERLVAESRFFDLPVRATSGAPDVIQYRVKVEVEGRGHEITADDQTLGDALRKLATRVLAGE